MDSTTQQPTARFLFHTCTLSSRAVTDLRKNGIIPVKVDHLCNIRFLPNGAGLDDVFVDALDCMVNSKSYDILQDFQNKQRSRIKTLVQEIKAKHSQ